MADRFLRIGVAGLSRGFVLTLPTFRDDPRVRLVAAADPRPEARAAFEAEFGGRTYADVDALCGDPAIDLVYVASPHRLHAPHAIAAARAGKHVLVEKPMALDLADCRAMRSAAEQAGVALIVGPSHSYDLPIAAAAERIAGGAYGPVRMITVATYTDFLYRPRAADELDPEAGGGVVFGQGAHQVDVALRLAGAKAKSVRANVLALDPARGGEGAYQALVSLQGGASASLSYCGYGRFETDALTDWVGELGAQRDPTDYGAARRRLAGAPEPELKRARAYGAGGAALPAPIAHEHFGLVIASCEHADLRPTPTGLEIYGETRETEPLPLQGATRTAVIDEVWGAVVEGRPPLHDGAWGEHVLAVCLAMRRSARDQREVTLAEIEEAT